MANLFNEDFQDFLRALWQHEVRYVLVGGYWVILHGYSRTTGDLDLWVEKSAANNERLTKAFFTFGMPVFDMSAHNFLANPAIDVFTFGRPPVAIDILVAIDIITQLKGLDFKEAFEAAAAVEVDNLPVRLIQYQHLLQAKKAAG
jgi:hypothetical protein